MPAINVDLTLDPAGASSAVRAEAMMRPSADMLGVTYQSPPPPCNFEVVSPVVTTRLKGGYPTNKVAPDIRGRLSIFASTDAMGHGRLNATKIATTTFHFFITHLRHSFGTNNPGSWV